MDPRIDYYALLGVLASAEDIVFRVRIGRWRSDITRIDMREAMMKPHREWQNSPRRTVFCL
jgi:hypothetical protein